MSRLRAGRFRMAALTLAHGSLDVGSPALSRSMRVPDDGGEPLLASMSVRRRTSRRIVFVR
ncbi:hypothetical protein DXZ75_10010 [Streptomyces sp. AcE210]|nr:hypothetical protein DXZ75_10010 [Streptomyces sp. AcE210]